MFSQKEFQDHFKGINFRFSRLYADYLTKVDLTLQQYTLLNFLHEQGPVSMKASSEALHVTKPAVTYIVDQLEKRKLIKRIPSIEDRRVILLEIQKRGVEIVQGAQKVALEVLMPTLNSFPQTQRSVVGKFYKKLSRRMDIIINRGGYKK